MRGPGRRAGAQRHLGDEPGWEGAAPRRARGLLVAVSAALALVVGGVALGGLGGGVPADHGGEGDAAIPVTEAEPQQAAPERSPLAEADGGAESTGDEDDGASAPEGSGSTPPVGSWRQVPEAPITGRWGSLAVWTGREALFWGGWSGMGGRGGDALSDGAAYDPAADAWRPMAAAPRPALAWEETAVWTGEEMVVLGSDQPIAYDRTADAWRDVAGPPPGDWAWESAGWAGDEIVVVSAGRDDAAGALAAYDPEADGWRSLPEPPLTDWDGRSSVWLDGRLLLIGTTDQDGWRRSSLAVFDPEAPAWSVPEPAPAGGRWLPKLVADPEGGRALAVAGGEDAPAAVYEWSPHRAWRRLPDLPAAPLWEPSTIVTTGAGLLAWEAEAPPTGLVLRDDAEWVPVAEPPPSARFGSMAAWTGEELVVWAGGRGLRREADGAALRLD